MCLWLCILAMLAVAAPPSAGAADPPSVRLDRDVADVWRPPAELAAELAALGEHEWAGEYRAHSTFQSTILWITPQGAAFTWTYGCFVMHERAHGVVRGIERDALQLELPAGLDPRYTGMGEELIRVRWCGRHYLIPEWRMAEFCEDVRCGRERRLDKAYLLRRGECGAPLTNLPEVPGQWAGNLPTGRICARVTEMAVATVSFDPNAGQAVYKLRLTLDAGANDGIEPYMRLRRDDSPPGWWAQVETVSPRTSVLTMNAWMPAPEEDWPCPGWEFSSVYFGPPTPAAPPDEP